MFYFATTTIFHLMSHHSLPWFTFLWKCGHLVNGRSWNIICLIIFSSLSYSGCLKNPAPVDRWFIPLSIGFQSSFWWCRISQPSAVFPWYSMIYLIYGWSHECCIIFLWFLHFPITFPIIFLWFLHFPITFPIIFLWFLHFPIIFPSVSHHFPIKQRDSLKTTETPSFG